MVECSEKQCKCNEDATRYSGTGILQYCITQYSSSVYRYLPHGILDTIYVLYIIINNVIVMRTQQDTAVLAYYSTVSQSTATYCMEF
jgi:hypothetical protein